MGGFVGEENSVEFRVGEGTGLLDKNVFIGGVGNGGNEIEAVFLQLKWLC